VRAKARTRSLSGGLISSIVSQSVSGISSLQSVQACATSSAISFDTFVRPTFDDIKTHARGVGILTVQEVGEQHPTVGALFAGLGQALPSRPPKSSKTR
jgi:hypothetical protein